MPSPRIKTTLNDQTYFVTLTIKNWYYLFDRHHRFEILEDCFSFCQKHKDLKIFAFVFMLNHLHFIGQALDMIAVVRDMKKYLSKEFQKNIIATEPQVLALFREKDGSGYTVWQPSNYPELIESEAFLKQKIGYIHLNPVRKQYVYRAEDWRWSSASNTQTKIKISPFD